jgi:hypothetical protein
MEPKELRIGNLVNTINGITEVTDVLEFGINMNHDCWLHDTQHIDPIPLTEEWLVKVKEFDPVNISRTVERYALGKIEIDDFRTLHFAISDIDNTSIDVYLLTSCGDSLGSKLYLKLKIKSVHEIQNYYYYTKLTGEELTIKKK